MFWAKRLKSEEVDAVAWVLPYSDLVTLLLGVFVLIASMSELRQGPRYDRLRQAVQAEFGFEAQACGTPPVVPAPRPLTLTERLERAGLAGTAKGSLGAGATLCEVVTEGGRMVIRVSGPAAFDPLRSELKTEAEQAIEQIAVYLADGQSTIEIRGHSDEPTVPSGSPYRDTMDLSYQRAHAVASVVTRAGVPRERVFLCARGDADGADRRIELVVQAAPNSHGKRE